VFWFPAFRLSLLPFRPALFTGLFAETPSFHFYDRPIIMAVAAVRPRAHYERGFARSHERRSPQAGVSSTVAPFPATPVMDGTKATSTPEAASTVKLPTDVKALAGVITVLGLFILGECHIDPGLSVFLITSQLSQFGRSGLGDSAE
jgi:hypothetical protein